MLSGSDEDYNCPLSLILDELYFHVQFLTALHYGEHLTSDLPFKKGKYQKSCIYDHAETAGLCTYLLHER